MSMAFESCQICGVEVTAITYTALHDFILTCVRDERRVPIYNLNAHATNVAAGDPEFHRILQSADLVFADGQGIVFAARLLGCHILYRITFADWLPRFAAFSSRYQLSWYLLGGHPGVAELAAVKLREIAPGLTIVGCHHGYFAKGGMEEEAVIHDINRHRPHILIVAMGMPWQEHWIDQHSAEINANVFLAGGACLDYLSGRLPRCPGWMGPLGIEWLYRLYREPKRLAARYLLGNPRFIARFVKEQALRAAGMETIE